MDNLEEFVEDPVCRICNLVSGLEKDQLFETNDIQAHFFCLLFSSGLGQKGKENDGIKGFLASDIRKEIKRGARLKCVHCKKKGATVGCAEPKCKKSYHLPCGSNNDSLQQYFDQFKSFCKEHRPVQKVSRAGGKKSDKKDNICSICQEKILRKATMKTIWSPCCEEFLHRTCIQGLAYSAGAYIFRCPTCNNKDEFCVEMKRMGVYLPEQDASWENGTNFQDIDENPVKICHAKICFCSQLEGRAYHKEHGLWDILLCKSCGSKGIHAKCGGLEDFPDAVWDCYSCRKVLKEDKPKFREHTDKLWSMDAEKDKTPSTVHNPNRLFEALLATLPHLQSLEEPLTRSSDEEKKNLQLTITPVFKPVQEPQSTSSLQPSFPQQPLEIFASPSVSSQPHPRPAQQVVSISVVDKTTTGPAKPFNLPGENGTKRSTKIIEVGKSKNIKELFDYSLEDIIRTRLSETADSEGNITSVPSQVSVNGFRTGEGFGKVNCVSSCKDGFPSKQTPMFRYVSGDPGPQRKMTDYFLNRKH